MTHKPYVIQDLTEALGMRVRTAVGKYNMGLTLSVWAETRLV
jgi:hypothetical protein